MIQLAPGCNSRLYFKLKMFYFKFQLIKACQKKRSGRSLTSSDNDFFLENNDRVKRNTKKAIKRTGKPALDRY